jgi:BolA protein
VSTAETIERKLKAALAPTHLKIIDESARHQGHAGARPEGETHFRVEIVAAAFEGRSRLDRHRMITDLLAEELASRIHALSLRTRAPSEHGDG